MLKFFTNKPFAIYNAHPAGEKTVFVRRLFRDKRVWVRRSAWEKEKIETLKLLRYKPLL